MQKREISSIGDELSATKAIDQEHEYAEYAAKE